MPSERVQRRIDRLLDEAESAADHGDWNQVAKAVEAVLSVDSQNTDALDFQTMAAPYLRGSGPEVTSSVEQPKSAQSPGTLAIEPTSFSSGRYTVSKFLGEGGKKKVYLAHDNTLDRDVAFALIKTEGLDATSRERVKREAQAMGRMGTHPCIMPIYDLGEETDANGVAQPFMVQPLMGGGDVEGLIEDADGPLPLEDAIRIATQTAQGLVFAHGKGIVHRDLKPGNVWMDEDGAAKIGDFGLAVATDRSRLTVEKMMVGTVNYMPPEQATGGEVTPKADLYSLGAMLYEMSTGRVPFMGDDDIAVISQHVNTPPVAPSWHNALIPKTLDSLILRMMAKDPSERPADADEVLAALNAVDLAAVEERDDSGKGSLDAMAGGVFVGRHKEMDQLKAGFEEVLSGKGRMVTLVGEPGIGKTRTAHELATYAAMRGAKVLWGRSYESGGAPPYWPWVQAIRSHVAATESETLRNQLSSTAPVIAEVVPDVKAKLPDTLAPTPIEDPESARFRLFDSISTFLKNIASTTPVVLMLEDLHWADKPSLMLLEFVARELANSRIMIVGNYRDMELNRRHPLSVTLGDLSRERLFERVVLRGLQKHDVQRFIEIAAGITPPPALVDTVHSQTEGNPLFVTETVRLLIQEGDITSGQSTSGGTTSWEIRIPEGVREVIGRRLDRLSERTNEVLTIAAVIGRQFRFPVLKMLMEDTTDGQLLDALDEALSARIIEELPIEIGLYQFTHAQMQETLTNELSLTRRVRLHAGIAKALEEHYGDQAEKHAAELVEHFAEAETVLGTDRLNKYLIHAGEAALAAFSYEQALGLFTRAEERIEKSDELMRAHALRGIGHAANGIPGPNNQTALDSLNEAFDIYERNGWNSRAIDTALVTLAIGGLTGSERLTSKGLSLVKPGSNEHGWMSARHGVSLYSEVGDFDGSLEALDIASEIATSLNDQKLIARVAAHRCQRASSMDEVDDVITYGLEALELAKSADDPATGARVISFMAAAAIGSGRPEVIDSSYEKALNFARSQRNIYWENMAHMSQAKVAMCRGDWEQARSAIQLAGQSSNSESERTQQLLDCIDRTLNGDPKSPEDIRFWEQQIDKSLIGAFHRQSVVGMAVDAAHLSRSNSLRTKVYEELDLMPTEGPHLAFLRSITTLKAYLDVEGEDPTSEIPGYSTLASRKPRIDVMSAISIDRVLGRALSRRGQNDEASDRFNAAISFCRDAGFRPELAWSCADFSDVLLDRNAAGDHEKAIELQDEAIAIATELGMKPLLERVLAKREILKA